jgi:hypothetical protein
VFGPGSETLRLAEVIGGVAVALIWLLGWTWVRTDSRRRLARRLGRWAGSILGAVPIAGPLLYILLRPRDTILERSGRTRLRDLLEQMTDNDGEPSVPEKTSVFL